MAFEENEISVASQGGTEMMKRGLAQRLPEGLADDFQVICSRIRQLEENKIRVYWIHDLPGDPETAHLKEPANRDKFHKLVFCGNWQYQQYQTVLGVPYNDHSIVLETAIDPIPFVGKIPDVVRLVYTSTPQRGLELLVPVFEKLAETHKHIHLDVFSSFAIYGWSDRDKQYEELYERIRQHPQMTYHGFATNDVVRTYLQQAHIFAYPSIWMECNSRSLIEAMSAGLMCVHPNLAGLADTSGGLTFMYQGDSDHNIHANKFFHALNHAIGIVNNQDMQNYLQFVKMYADSRYNWTKIASQWEDVLKTLKHRYPTEQSRNLPAPMFSYRVG